MRARGWCSFNEAGALTPRKVRVWRRRLRRLRCFNEAGALTPRKGRRNRTGWKFTFSFNEAGALTPRKVLYLSLAPGAPPTLQ